MTALLLFGFLLGVRHALDADHVAAVASLATRSSSVVNTMRVAAAWGLGHTAALLVFGSLLLGLDASLPRGAGRMLEAAVGVMLIMLGADVLRRWRRKRIHVHAHRHDDGNHHVHVHAHEEEAAHDRTHHRHEHVSGLLPRALVVGSVHGMAGTAGLTLLSLQASLHSLGWALVYLALFGVGSILGMVLFSLLISLPLRMSARYLDWAAGGLEALLGAVTVALGCWVALEAIVVRAAAG
jgi:ABC-type nickel/cobalt efflux system permease component RcnA